MRHRFNNIRTKLILAFSLILIIPAVIIGLSSYMSAKDAMEKQIAAAAGENIKILNTIIDNTISPKIHDIEMLSNQASENLYEGHESPEIRNQLAQYAALHPEILSIYVGTQEGYFIQEPVINDTSTYDPRTRDWYKQSMEQNGEILVSSPYKDAAVDNMVVTISKTTKDHSGVISVDITLDYITKLTNQVTIGNEGFAFLLDENMHFISHPTGEGGWFAEQ